MCVRRVSVCVGGGGCAYAVTSIHLSMTQQWTTFPLQDGLFVLRSTISPPASTKTNVHDDTDNDLS